MELAHFVPCLENRYGIEQETNRRPGDRSSNQIALTGKFDQSRTR